MRYCKHTQLLGIAAKDGEILLQASDRLQTYMEDLPAADSQYPSLCVLIGNRSKATALKELISHSQVNELDTVKPNGRRAHGEIHLHVQPSTTFSNRPVLFAEGDLPVPKVTSGQLLESDCHEVRVNEPLMVPRASVCISILSYYGGAYGLLNTAVSMYEDWILLFL